MRYHLNYQYMPKGRSRPLDDGMTIDVPHEGDKLFPVPVVGDFVSLIATKSGANAFRGRVKSRLFFYFVDDEGHSENCAINIVVEETDDDWGALIKE